MGLKKLEKALKKDLSDRQKAGSLKGEEPCILKIRPPKGEKGPRYLLKGMANKEFIKMNSNSYLGLSLLDEMLDAEEENARKFGTGPGAVRFISGTSLPHIELEKGLA